MRDFLDITARDNKLIKLIRSLQSSARARRENGLFVLEGLRICMDAEENGIIFKKLVISRSFGDKFPEAVERFSANSQALVRVPDNLFEYIADTDSPQGVIALAQLPEGGKKPEKSGRYIALENVNDPSNLGAVARTAEALGESGIVVTVKGCDPYSPKALRASMGTLLRMPLYITDNVCALAQSVGLRTFACVPASDAQRISDIAFSDGDMLLIGNEANGITDETEAVSDYLITIPMRGKAESLNAAVAASIAMWEMMK
jgi:TrmH family RNA methyltransferase